MRDIANFLGIPPFIFSFLVIFTILTVWQWIKRFFVDEEKKEEITMRQWIKGFFVGEEKKKQ